MAHAKDATGVANAWRCLSNSRQRHPLATTGHYTFLPSPPSTSPCAIVVAITHVKVPFYIVPLALCGRQRSATDSTRCADVRRGMINAALKSGDLSGRSASTVRENSRCGTANFSSNDPLSDHTSDCSIDIAEAVRKMNARLL